MYDLPDYLGRYQQASQGARANVAGMERVPPYYDKSKGLKIMEGAIGGALAGASMGTAFGGGAAPAAAGGAQPGPSMVQTPGETPTMQPKFNKPETVAMPVSPGQAASGGGMSSLWSRITSLSFGG